MATLACPPLINKLSSERTAFGPSLKDPAYYPSNEFEPANPPSSLPCGFPESINTERVWSSNDLRDEASFIVHLTRAEICEIENGLNYFSKLRQNMEQPSRETFPLPTLSTKLENLALQLHFGSGFIILRGLDPNKYSSADNLLIYLGITSFIAEERGRQDSDGNMLIHIKDYHFGDKRQAPFSNRAVGFHNDQCDIIAMYMLSKAAEGGESYIASSGQVYNTIASMRPDLICVLAEQSWLFNEFSNPSQWTTRPLLYNFPTHGPAFCFNTRHLANSGLESGPNGAPGLTSLQVEALELVEKTAKANAYSITMKPGDIQLLNNFSVIHARAAFRDQQGESERHILRLWLSNKRLAWGKPENLEIDRWTAYETLRNGERGQRWPIDPRTFTTERISRKYESCS